jgi:hypothetical protein
MCIKMTAFWDIGACSFVEVDRRFRGAYCLITTIRDSSSWWWRQYAHPKRRATSTRLHCSISQNTVIWMYVARDRLRWWTHCEGCYEPSDSIRGGESVSVLLLKDFAARSELTSKIHCAPVQFWPWTWHSNCRESLCEATWCALPRLMLQASVPLCKSRKSIPRKS